MPNSVEIAALSKRIEEYDAQFGQADMAKPLAMTVPQVLRAQIPDEGGDWQFLHDEIDDVSRAFDIIGSNEPDKVLSESQFSIISRVVQPNGTRPSIIVHNGNLVPLQVPPNQFGSIAAQNMASASSISQQEQVVLRRAYGSVGKVMITEGDSRPYRGTGFMVAPNLLATNCHVIEQILSINPQGLNQGKAIVRFAGHPDNLVGRLSQMIFFPPNPGGTLRRFDFCLIRISFPNDQQPPPIRIHLGALPFEEGTRAFILGYPGNEPFNQQHPDHHLYFRGINGRLRLSPGRLSQVSHWTEPVHPSVFTHDATTYGGNSGSPVLMLHSSGPIAIGIDMAGLRGRENYFCAFSPMSEQVGGAIQAFLAS